MLGRRKKDASAAEADQSAESVAAEQSDEMGSVTFRGPRDISDVEPSDDRIDLGALQVTGVAGLSLQVSVDEKTQQVSMVTMVLEDAAVQVQVFAAPRSDGIWDDVRGQIMTSITGSGGLVEEIQGAFGTELRARVAGQSGAMQPARFVGIDGPRWFVRGLFLGSAAGESGHADLEEAFATPVVVRGDEAMAPGEPLPMQVPAADEAP